MSEVRHSFNAAPAPTPDAPEPSAEDPSWSLDQLRERLDTVDAELHRLIAERLAIVNRIAAAKGPGGVVIRPDREATVVAKRIAAAPSVPADILAGFWRRLISTACMAQRPYRVHVTQGTAEAGRLLHSAAPAVLHSSGADALAALAGAPHDVALLAEADIPSGPLGEAHAILAAETDAGRIVAFGGDGVERANGPAALVADPGGAHVTETPGDGDAVLARIHLFPVPLSVSVPAS